METQHGLRLFTFSPAPGRKLRDGISHLQLPTRTALSGNLPGLYPLRDHPLPLYPIYDSKALTRFNPGDTTQISVISVNQLVRFCLFRSRAISAFPAIPPYPLPMCPTSSQVIQIGVRFSLWFLASNQCHQC